MKGTNWEWDRIHLVFDRQGRKLNDASRSAATECVSFPVRARQITEVGGRKPRATERPSPNADPRGRFRHWKTILQVVI